MTPSSFGIDTSSRIVGGHGTMEKVERENFILKEIVKKYPLIWNHDFSQISGDHDAGITDI